MDQVFYSDGVTFVGRCEIQRPRAASALIICDIWHELLGRFPTLQKLGKPSEQLVQGSLASTFPLSRPPSTRLRSLASHG